MCVLYTFNFCPPKMISPLTSAVGLCLDDLTDASSSNAILRSQLNFIPGAAAQVVQFEGALSRTDENIFPLLCVVYRILKHKTCSNTRQDIHTMDEIILRLIKCRSLCFPLDGSVRLLSQVPDRTTI